jgi:hypothetical protein
LSDLLDLFHNSPPDIGLEGETLAYVANAGLPADKPGQITRNQVVAGFREQACRECLATITSFPKRLNQRTLCYIRGQRGLTRECYLALRLSDGIVTRPCARGNLQTACDNGRG